MALLTGGALFMSGYSLGLHAGEQPGTPVSDEQAFAPFWDTYHTITDRYALGPVDQTSLIQGAIRGMIGALGDPYSAYLTSDEYRQSLLGLNGQFEGIGASIASQAPDGTQGCTPLGPDVPSRRHRAARRFSGRDVPGCRRATSSSRPTGRRSTG